MSRITLAPNASGTAAFTLAAPATNTDRTLTLPDATTTLVGTDATQTLSNKTLTAPTLTGVASIGSGSGVYANNADMRLETATGRGWRMGTTSSASTLGYFYIQGTTDNFSASFIDSLNIDASGNVGIGKTAASRKLEVAGEIAAMSGSDATSLTHDGTNGVLNFTKQGLIYTVTNMIFHTASTERMRIDASGQVLFGLTSSIGTGVAQFRGGIRGDNASGDPNFAIEARGSATIYSSSIYNSTTATGASVSITGTAGFLQRSTSSIKYKTDVEDLDQSLSANIYQMRPVWYRSKCAMDRKDWSYLGLIAEEVAEIEPRLVHWGEVKEDGTQEPEGVMYDRLTVLLLAEVKKQQQMIQALQADIAALKGV